MDFYAMSPQTFDVHKRENVTPATIFLLSPLFPHGQFLHMDWSPQEIMEWVKNFVESTADLEGGDEQ